MPHLCLQRLGMAYLQGQLGLARDSARGVQLLRTSAQIADQLADPDTATPLWVWGMLINHEFDLGPSVPLPFSVLPRLDPVDAGRWIKKSAYLHETKAQCRMGTAYEYAQLGLPYDPLMSVQYYSLASQGGSEEADMALSKWFLCGAEGVFSPDEELAYTFAEKAADKGLPSAIFALAYYNEVGLQGEPQLEVAKRFYEKAS
ncbi:uncharacterized protein L969DRAFT_47998, partial [Mixia osmundae IAM 14324]|uniref:uncharacterized protein n=1 Tax=Mixia osmundae (strain CBS 9802 / IAM 14324 / JCM 22182 / KY 12970) TaxID=764103 RepID=UPI0004A5482B